MYGRNCSDKLCFCNSVSGCSHPRRAAFMLCEKPSRKRIENIIKRLGKESVIDLSNPKKGDQ